MKIQLFFYFLIGALQALPIFSETTSSEQRVLVQYSPELKKSLNAIRKLKEGSKLISEILKQGPLRLSAAKNPLSKKFGACWDVDGRVIYIDLSFHRSEDDIIGSLIFELYNALKTPQFNHLYALATDGKIGKENYIKSIEHIEYMNSKESAALIKLGIEKKIFNPNAQIQVYDNFNEHYHYQKISGHSAVHGKIYDQLRPYNKRIVRNG